MSGTADPAGGRAESAPDEQPRPADRAGAGLADGEWHRLHPATPLLRGGIALLAIIGIVIANLRERLIELFLPEFCQGPGCENTDPFAYIIENGYLVTGLLVLLGALLLLTLAFYVSWRMHTFRVTDEVVEVRSGILFRTHRKARLDRIQGINIQRPFVARLFGTAKLEIEQAGQDANVQLFYLGNANADGLRAAILKLASGARREHSDTGGGATSGSLLDRRLAELTAPELDPEIAAHASVVRMSTGRLIGSTLLSGATVAFLAMAVAVVVAVLLTIFVTPELIWVLFTLVPIMIGVVSYGVNRVLKFLRYSIAATPDGVRVGYGLLSTRNDTLPPGRIHSVSISQNLFWRPADWWMVRVNRASRTTSADGQQQNTVVLPVGSREDAFRVLELLLPALLGDEAGETSGLLERGLTGRGDDPDGFTTSPRRARVLRWFSWRRNGYALTTASVLLRRGAIWRELVVVPSARMQSVSVEQGPLVRALRLAAVHVHTVQGPISARLGALDTADAETFFRDAAAIGVAAAAADRTHRWGAGPE